VLRMDKNSLVAKGRESSIADRTDKILELCQDKEVLDVGCVGQDFGYESKDWLHGKIEKVGRDIVGVDIEEASIRELRNRGYKVFFPSELEKLDRKFGRIVISDVIEHVNDPVQTLKGYAQFLDDNGVMVITAPNRFWPRRAFQVLLFDDILVNGEHTIWIDVRTFLEILNRAGLDLDGCFWVRKYYSIYKLDCFEWVLHYIVRGMDSIRRHFALNMMFIARKERG
jgi:SAM-dependent methyltransferase